jgi:hypothetical protein
VFRKSILVGLAVAAAGAVGTVQAQDHSQSPAEAHFQGPISEATAAPPAPDPSAAKPGPVTGGDVLIGVRAVSLGAEHDVIRVEGDVGKFGRLRLRVLENDIFLTEVKIVYADGNPDTLAVNAEIKQVTRTRWFRLGGDRFIKEIRLGYRARPNSKAQARVEVWGEFADGWLDPQGEGPKYNQGWVLLGAQSAGFTGFENDLIPVGRNEGGFKRIRVAARDRAITLNELRVVYDSSQEDIFPVHRKIEAGSTFGPVSLKGGGTRAIKEIRAKYSTRSTRWGAGQGGAILEVWGQH